MRSVARSFPISLCAVLMICVQLAAEPTNSDWTPGMYWTYQADVIARATGHKDRGTVSFLVLASDASLGFQTWHLATITQWYDGTDIMITTSHSDPLPQAPWRRWPQLVNYMPPKHLPDFQIQFRQTVASQGLPWFEDETSMRVETTRADGWSESISLAEMPSSTVVTPASSFDDAACMQYTWASVFEGTEVKSLEGLAWWSPEVGWWVRTEGQELTDGRVVRTYELALTDWGVLSAEDASVRLANALSSTAAIDPELADGLRRQLDLIGVDFTGD